MKLEDLNAAIDQYEALEEDIKATLGWKDDWRLLPLADDRQSYWMLAGGDLVTGNGSSVVTSEEPLTLESVREGKKVGSAEVYTQRHHERWVFRAGDVVLIPIDTHTDGNVLLTLLDAKKETTNPELRACWQEYWGTGR